MTNVRKRLLWTATVISALLFVGAFAFGEDFEHKLETSVSKTMLPNGLRLITVVRRYSPTLSLYIRFRAGSVDEDSNSTGTAHLLEHLLFKGTQDIGTKDWNREKPVFEKVISVGKEIDRAIIRGDDPSVIRKMREKLALLQKEQRKWIIKDPYDRIYNRHGATGFNASTSADITTYKVNLPKNRLKLWAYIESERLRNPVFREYFTERNVVREERRMRIDSNGSGLLFEQFNAMAFLSHPYRHPVIGWDSVIGRLDYETTWNFFREHYGPQNMVITIVGDLDPKKTTDIIRRYFGTLPNTSRYSMKTHAAIDRPGTVSHKISSGNTETRKYRPAFIRQRGERRFYIEHPDKPVLVIGFHKPNMPASEDYIFDVIDSLLSNGRTSLLYRRLVLKEKLATSVYTMASYPGSRYPNLFVIVATPAEKVGVHRLEKRIYDILDDLSRKPVAQRTLRKIKNQIEADFIYKLESNNGLASSIGYYEILVDDWKYMLTYRQKIAGISPEDIRHIAAKYFRPQNRTVGWIQSTSVRPETKTATTGK